MSLPRFEPAGLDDDRLTGISEGGADLCSCARRAARENRAWTDASWRERGERRRRELAVREHSHWSLSSNEKLEHPMSPWPMLEENHGTIPVQSVPQCRVRPRTVSEDEVRRM